MPPANSRLAPTALCSMGRGSLSLTLLIARLCVPLPWLLSVPGKASPGQRKASALQVPSSSTTQCHTPCQAELLCPCLSGQAPCSSSPSLLASHVPAQAACGFEKSHLAPHSGLGVPGESCPVLPKSHQSQGSKMPTEASRKPHGELYHRSLDPGGFSSNPNACGGNEFGGIYGPFLKDGQTIGRSPGSQTGGGRREAGESVEVEHRGSLRGAGQMRSPGSGKVRPGQRQPRWAQLRARRLRAGGWAWG